MKLQAFLHIKALFNTLGLSYVYVLGTLKNVSYLKKYWIFSLPEAHNSEGNNLIKLCKKCILCHHFIFYHLVFFGK